MIDFVRLGAWGVDVANMVWPVWISLPVTVVTSVLALGALMWVMAATVDMLAMGIEGVLRWLDR